MYFWNLRELKSQLAVRSLTDREVLSYVVVLSALTSAAFSGALMAPIQSFNRWDALGAVWSVALAIGGTLYVYRRNGGANGEHFLQRWLVIGWVVALRLAALLIVAAIGLLAAVEIVDEISEETTWYELLLLAVWELIFYERLAHHVGDVAQQAAHRSAG